MNSKYTVLILTVSLIVLYGCSRNRISKKIIENNSKYTIDVTLFGGYPPNRKVVGNFLIASKKSQTVVELESSVGTFYDEGLCARSDIDSISIEIQDNPTLKITKDLTNDENNWTFSKKEHNQILHGGFNTNTISVECRATITDADIVPK
jgi:hypothetical protein